MARTRFSLLSLSVVALLCLSAPAADSSQLGQQLVSQIGTTRGIVAVLGADRDVAVSIALASQLQVNVRVPARKDAARLQQAANKMGLGIKRLAILRGKLNQLPYATNTMDAVVVTNATGATLQALSASEIIRALRPEGRAIIGKSLQSEGGDVQSDQLRNWLGKTKARNVKVVKNDSGTWLQFTKPPLAGADDWSHWEKGPDNNPVSTDSVIKAPYMTQFMAQPYYIGMPSITTAAGGRTFLAVGHIAHHRREWDTLYKLIARNGYNGTILWKRNLPDGYLVHRSAFIATSKTFYMINGDHGLKLDAATGREQGTIRLPGVPGFWKWMVMKDDVLYVMTGLRQVKTKPTKGDRSFGGWSWADLSPGYYGKDVPFGYGRYLAAYDLKKKKLLWKHTEEADIDARAMALRDNQVYLFCPSQHARCLNAKTGKIVWTNANKNVRDLIAQPGKGLTSTPGFKTACLVVATPEAIIIQGQTRMNVVALSTKTGYPLWSKRKITNNPNAIYVDGKVILGVGKNGEHVAIDPVSGKVQDKLGFFKVACTRLTASGDSFFCRGEGMMRFDRKSKNVLIDGAVRPACNDGALPANGLLYLGPWQCDCNLSLIGRVARCSAGDFKFDIPFTKDRLETVGSLDESAAVKGSAEDWVTYRANNHRSSGSLATVQTGLRLKWRYDPLHPHTMAPPIAVGGFVFSAGQDGVVRAQEAASGKTAWVFTTASPIKAAPTFWQGRLYIGGGDGYAYCLDAGNGKLIWRFRAAPVERFVPIYGNLTSTWPVNSGVLVHEGVAYFAAGIIDHDGTYVYAVDARTGQLKWQNTSSGHLSSKIRKGISVQGNLTILGNRLLMAGGNQVSPAQYDIKTGKCLSKPFKQGRPKANGGKFLGVFRNTSVVVGGRILYSAPENVSTKGSFVAFTQNRGYRLSFGSIPPAWNDESLIVVNFKHGKLNCCDAAKSAERMSKGYGSPPPGRRWLQNLLRALEQDNAVRWRTNFDVASKFEVLSLAVGKNAVAVVYQFQQKFRAHPQRFLALVDHKSGKVLNRLELNTDPLPDATIIDRDGQVIVPMIGGSMLCFGK